MAKRKTDLMRVLEASSRFHVMIAMSDPTTATRYAQCFCGWRSTPEKFPWGSLMAQEARTHLIDVLKTDVRDENEHRKFLERWQRWGKLFTESQT